MTGSALRPVVALIAAVLCLTAGAARAQSGGFEFHGLRMGMALEEIEAAGYGLAKGTDTPIAGAGWIVTRGLPPSLHRLHLYQFNHELFQIDVTYPPVRGEAALAFVRALRERYGAEEGSESGGAFDPLRDAKWSWRGTTFHYSPGIRDDASLTPNLLITDEALYQRALEMKERPPQGRGL